LDGHYIWIPYGPSSQVAIVEGLYITMVPDNPKSGELPVLYFYTYPVFIIAPKSFKSEEANKIVNTSWE
jgi:hypothetical protein